MLPTFMDSVTVLKSVGLFCIGIAVLTAVITLVWFIYGCWIQYNKYKGGDTVPRPVITVRTRHFIKKQEEEDTVV